MKNEPVGTEKAVKLTGVENRPGFTVLPGKAWFIRAVNIIGSDDWGLLKNLEYPEPVVWDEIAAAAGAVTKQVSMTSVKRSGTKNLVLFCI
jgi:hypothetical protein